MSTICLYLWLICTYSRCTYNLPVSNVVMGGKSVATLLVIEALVGSLAVSARHLGDMAYIIFGTFSTPWC